MTARLVSPAQRYAGAPAEGLDEGVEEGEEDLDVIADEKGDGHPRRGRRSSGLPRK